MAENDEDVCLMCLSGAEEGELLPSDYPCACKFRVHRPCLVVWEKSSRICFVCKKSFVGADVGLELMPPRDMFLYYAGVVFELLFVDGMLSFLPFLLMMNIAGAHATTICGVAALLSGSTSRVMRHHSSRRELIFSFIACLIVFLATLPRSEDMPFALPIFASITYAIICTSTVVVFLPLHAVRRASSGRSIVTEKE